MPVTRLFPETIDLTATAPIDKADTGSRFSGDCRDCGRFPSNPQASATGRCELSQGFPSLGPKSIWSGQNVDLDASRLRLTAAIAQVENNVWARTLAAAGKVESDLRAIAEADVDL